MKCFRKINLTYSDSDIWYGDGTKHLINNSNFDDDMASFDKTTVQILPKIHFHRNVLKFFLGCIISFGAKIAAMNNKFDENPFNPRWEFLTSVKF